MRGSGSIRLALKFAAVLMASAFLVGIAFQPPKEHATTTTSALLASPTTIPPTTTSIPPAATISSESERRPRLAPTWELIGEGDRVGGQIFGTGKELIVWGGREFPVGLDDGPFLHTGVAWNHLSGTVRPIPTAPFSDCRGTSGSVWTGIELVVWFRAYADPGCREGMVAGYDPLFDEWREIEAPGFIEAGTSAIWTGTEVLAWNQGLALDPYSGTVRKFEPLEINESHQSRVRAHWTGDGLLVMGGTRVFHYRVESDTWEQLEPPPIGAIAQASAWTGERLLAVNYDMEAALFDPEAEEWRRIAPMPLRFWETLPHPIAADGLAMVQMGSSSAALDGMSWVTMPNAAMGWETPYAEGAIVIADGWLYQIGNFVVRRPLPVLVGGGVQTEDVIPLQTMLFDVPAGWTARLLPTEEADPGYGDRHAYQLTDDQTGNCEVEAWHGGEPPRVSDRVKLIRSWDGAEMQIGTDLANNLAVVDDFKRSSDWVAITCLSNEDAAFLASHVWVSP